MSFKKENLSRLLPELDILWNRKTIIIGEVGAGKTHFTTQIVTHILTSGEDSVAVLDMAPEARDGVGGKMNISALKGARYYTTTIYPPRLTGRTIQEVELLAKENASRIEKLFKIYQKAPARVLCINDVSIYLQAGALKKLWNIINISPTVIMNGYYGTTLGGGRFGEQEQLNMNKLCDKCDHVIHLKTDQIFSH